MMRKSQVRFVAADVNPKRVTAPLAKENRS